MKGMRGREKANARVIVPTAPYEVEVANERSELQPEQIQASTGEPLANGARVEAEKARNETK